MYPDLIIIGPYTLHSYGFMMVLGVVAGILVFRILASRSGLDPVRVTNLGIAVTFVGYIGAYFLYVLTRLWYDGFSMVVAQEALKDYALVWYGVAIFGIPFAWWYMRRYRLPVWRTFDALLPSVTLGHAIGRIGCFMAGCCYGKPTDAWVGIWFYSAAVSEEYVGIPLHPTQLYEAGGLFLLFLLLFRLNNTRRFDGQVFLAYLIGYPALRSIVEVFRGDQIRGFVIDEVLSTSQFISLAFVLLAAALLYLRLRQAKTSDAPLGTH